VAAGGEQHATPVRLPWNLHVYARQCDTWDRMRQPRTSVREALLGALLAGGTMTGAARLAKVSRATAYRITREPAFKADLDARLAAQRQPLEVALGQAMEQAVQTLRRLLEATTESVRLKAATVLLAPRQIATPPSPPQPGQSGTPTPPTAAMMEAMGIAMEKRMQQRLRAQGWAPPGETPGPIRPFFMAQAGNPVGPVGIA